MATNETIKDTKGSILLTGIVAEEDGQFVSYCRELGTASCGDTIEEAFDNLWDAVEVHLNALEETGEILRVLREKNIRIDYDDEPPIDEPYLRVPLGKIVSIHRKTLPAAVMA